DKTLCRIGTGVLVQKGKRFGILTAHHCLHACSPAVQLGSHTGTTLWLCLNRGRAILVQPVEAVEHELAPPQSEEFGPLHLRPCMARPDMSKENICRIQSAQTRSFTSQAQLTA